MGRDIIHLSFETEEEPVTDMTHGATRETRACQLKSMRSPATRHRHVVHQDSRSSTLGRICSASGFVHKNGRWGCSRGRLRVISE